MSKNEIFQSCIIYFSGTGSTAYFASKLGEYLRNHNCTVELKRLVKDLKVDLLKYDLIGFGSPVWVWRAPRVVTSFLSKLRLPNIPYFTFLTSGRNFGNGPYSMFKSLKNSGGIDLIYSTLIQDQGNLSIEKLESLRKQAPKKYFLLSIVGTISTYRWQMQAFVGKKKVDLNKCSKCKLCFTKICPSKAISPSTNNTPIFHENLCVGCMGCINLCPQLAIKTRSSKNRQPFVQYAPYILQNV